jgi:hypothetical protein
MPMADKRAILIGSTSSFDTCEETRARRNLKRAKNVSLSNAYSIHSSFMSFNFRNDKAVTRQSTADEMTGTLRPGNVVFKTSDPERLSVFWAALTGYEPRPLFGDFLGLRDPAGRGPNITFQRYDDDSLDPGRCHVDFYADDPDDVAERALQLGGDFVRRVSEGGIRWVVLTDPDGNEFCVVLSGSPDRVP